jgi:hypothetical protein
VIRKQRLKSMSGNYEFRKEKAPEMSWIYVSRKEMA